jgi:energy-coupling factor transporter ATP-binding protein EcfA2
MSNKNQANLLKFLECNLPVLPLNRNKEPIIYEHKFLDDNLPTIEDYKNVSPACDMFGLKCGNAQTKIEAIDFDLKNDPNRDDPEKGIWPKFKLLIDVSDLYVETSPHGIHILYRADNVPASEHLAFCRGYKGAVIETRGRGAYCAVAPSVGYNTITGDIFNLPRITSERVDDIKSACQSLSECPEKRVAKQKPSYYQRVFDKKHAADVLNILLKQDWTVYRDLPDRVYLTRPGKTRGVSATLFKTGVLYVFTSATNYSSLTAYSPFSIIAQQKGITHEDMERKVAAELGENHIKDIVTEVLKNLNKLKQIEMLQELYRIVITDMTKRGKFYCTEKGPYYFINKELIPVSIKQDDFCAYICDTYGLTKTESYSRKLYEEIRVHAMIKGQDTAVHTHSYYDPETNQIYVDNFDGSLYIVTTKDIYKEDNGTDGVMFLKSNGMPFEYTENTKDIDHGKLLFEGLTFNEKEHGITTGEYQQLFICWVMSIFFSFKTRCLVFLVGEKGSGKSVLFKKLLTILFGHDKGLKVLPEKEDDFNAIVTNNKIVIFDNVDSNRPWLNERIATCATGGELSMRKLYETNVEYHVSVDVFLGFTSRQPPARQDDVADRTIEFPLDRFNKFSSETQIMKGVVDNRDGLMSVFLHTLKICLQYQDGAVFETHTRIADFEIFCRKLFPELEETFKKITNSQRAITDDSFTDLLREYCRLQPLPVITKGATQLCQEMLPIAKSMNLTKLNLTSRGMSYKLKKTFDFVEIERINLPQRYSEYKFNILLERQPVNGDAAQRSFDSNRF